jgi:hypothetical protein
MFSCSGLFDTAAGVVYNLRKLQNENRWDLLTELNFVSQTNLFFQGGGERHFSPHSQSANGTSGGGGGGGGSSSSSSVSSHREEGDSFQQSDGGKLPTQRQW